MRGEGANVSRDVHDQALQAIIEAIMNHTVAVVVRGTELASGVVISAGDQSYIVTAGHVIEDARAEDLEFIFRPPGTFRHVPRSTDIREMLGRRATALPIQRIALSSDQDDLALLEISSDVVEGHRVSPYAFEERATSPSVGEQALVVGFPYELVKKVTNRAGEQGMGALPLAYVTEVSEENFQHERFSPDSHFLLSFAHPLDDMEITRPNGMSGGGVWTPPGFPPGDRIWTPEGIKLVGIQVRWFPMTKLLKAARIERLAALLLGSAY